MVLTFFKLKKIYFQQDQPRLIWSSFGWSSSAHKFGYQNAGQFWTVSTLWPITFERLVQMRWNHIPWKLDILSFPMNEESSNLDPKPESYACLKLGLLLMWMHLMQNALRCVKACDFGSCCLCLLIKRVLPTLARPKNVGIVDSCIAFDATLISHQQHQGTHLFGLDSSEYSM